MVGGPCLAAILAIAEAVRLRLEAPLALLSPVHDTGRLSSIMLSATSWLQSCLTGQDS